MQRTTALNPMAKKIRAILVGGNALMTVCVFFFKQQILVAFAFVAKSTGNSPLCTEKSNSVTIVDLP